MKTLKSMTAYVLEQDKLIEENDSYEFAKGAFGRVLDYAKFLSMPLGLKMFLPLDEYYSLIKEPTVDAYMQPKEIDRQFLEYDKALSGVLFEGFEICIGGGAISNNENCIIIVHKNGNYSLDGKQVITIEHLVKNNLTLTDNAIAKHKF